MFKIESYVTPILLSYVDKYVRDFKPADAQVSLWGGGVALHNLVIKEDVLQQEVSLPFTLISGRINELLIQVSWTRIMSEPIVVTIDTIECVLSLHPPDEAPHPETQHHKTQMVEAPPGYMQALVRRIVSNIALRVNHLIVKYVEDDIVLSLNVKHLSVDSADSEWNPAFADIDQTVPILRRLIQLDDLTLCLDKADSDGKIRFFHEPLLYRCQLNLRVLTRLVSANTRRASNINVQLRSAKLAWGVTSEQLTLLLRLLPDRGAPPAGNRSPAPRPRAPSLNQPPPSALFNTNAAEPTRNESWSEWAWSWMDRDSGVEEAPIPPAALPVHFDAYLDAISLVFKVMELEHSIKKRARSVLELDCEYLAVRGVSCKPTAMQFAVAMRSLELKSIGKCVCGHLDVNALSEKPTIYLSRSDIEDEGEWRWPEHTFDDLNVEVGQVATEHLKETPAQPAESSQKSQSQHESAASEEDMEPKQAKEDKLWQNMNPVLLMEFSHERTPAAPNTNPYDNPPLDFEYSDWVEECSIKVVIVPLTIRISMGLIHRLNVIRNIFQELAVAPPPEHPMRTLTVEECDSLSDNLPQRWISVVWRGVCFRIYPWDHSLYDRPTTTPLVLDIEVTKMTAQITMPLYPHRVCSAACQMLDDTGPLWQGARLHVTAALSAIQVKLTPLSEDKMAARPVARADLRLVFHSLQHSDYFTKPETVRSSYSAKIKEASISGSLARLQAAWQVVDSLLSHRFSALMKLTTLHQDAIHDEDAVAVEVAIEDWSMRGYLTNNINTHILVLQSARSTALRAIDGKMQQAWLFSAPDVPSTTPYLRIAAQWCKEPASNSLDYLGAWAEPTAICVDPLFIAWLAYKPNMKSDSQTSLNSRSGHSSHTLRKRTPPSSSGYSASASRSGSVAEMVHKTRPRSQASSSEPSERKEPQAQPTVTVQEAWWSTDRLDRVHARLRRMLLNVELEPALVYVPTKTAPAVDCACVREAMERHAATAPLCVCSLGRVTFHCSALMKHLWHEIRHDGPTFFAPERVKIPGEQESFPWKLRLSDMSCYTLESRAGVERSGKEKSAGGMRSQLRAANIVTPRTILELVTTTVTLSVVTKTVPKKHVPKPKDSKKHDEGEERIKYFTGGVQFQPTTFKELVRGPNRKKKTNEDVEIKPEPPPSNFPEEPTGPITSLSFHLHADTPPVTIRLDRDQVHVIATVIHSMKHIVALLKRPHPATQKQLTMALGGSHRSLLRSSQNVEENQSQSDTPSESRSELIPIFEAPEVKQANEDLKTYFWFQWVVSRATLIAATEQVKLAFVLEDAIATVDIQPVYNQLKFKVASASIKYSERTESNEWIAGALGGRVLEAREAATARDENHFLCVTITQARISNLPASWKEELHPKLLESKTISDSMWEIDASLAPLEALLRPSLLENIMRLTTEMAPHGYCELSAVKEQRNVAWQWPFCHISAGGLRLLVTTEEEDPKQDDTFMFEIGDISVKPHPQNPICRSLIATGADAGPGLTAINGFEGRQYEVRVRNVAVRSAKFQQLVPHEVSEIKGTASENPAHKWNQQAEAPSITPVLHSMEIGCVVAPAFYTGYVLAYGPAAELNLMSDCVVELSVHQLHLTRQLTYQFAAAVHEADVSRLRLLEDRQNFCPYVTFVNRPLLPSSSVFDNIADNISSQFEVDTGSIRDVPKTLANASRRPDSGMDTMTSHSTVKSERNLDSIPLKKAVSVAFVDDGSDASDYLEVYITMGVIEFSLYTHDDGDTKLNDLRPPKEFIRVAPKTNATKQKSQAKELKEDEEFLQLSPNGSDSRSITEVMRATDVGKSNLDADILEHGFIHRARVGEGMLPLVHLSFHQPNFYYWKKKSQRNVQISIFNMRLELGAGQSATAAAAGHWGATLMTAARGTVDPVSGIPPALLELQMTHTNTPGSTASNRGTISVHVERPVMFEVGSDRIRRVKAILDLVGQHQERSKIPDEEEGNPENSPLFKLRRLMVSNALSHVTIEATQVGATGSAGAVGWDSASLQLTAGARGERVTARGRVNALSMCQGQDSRHAVLLASVLGVEVEGAWEAWRKAEGGSNALQPTVHACVDCDRVVLDLRPSDLASLYSMLSHVTAKPASAPDNSAETILRPDGPRGTTNKGERSRGSFDSFELGDHYYKDDLRSGAFKITSGGQLPMAYQVTLNNGMVSWRYPHPRAITRIVAFPLPDQNTEAECVLEHYDSMLARWEPLQYFRLPVAEPREINLCASPPESVFAVTWRLRTCSVDDHIVKPFVFDSHRFEQKPDPLVIDKEDADFCTSKSDITAEQLSGVLRIDSYFAPKLLSRVRVTARMAAFELHVHNALPQLSSQSSPLDGYYVSKPLLRTHRMLSVLARDAALHAELASPAGALLLLNTAIAGEILDGATGTMERFVEETRIQAAASVPSGEVNKARVRCRTGTIRVGMHVPRLRTLQKLLLDWQEAFQKVSKAPPQPPAAGGCVEVRTPGSAAAAAASALDGLVSLWLHNTCTGALRVGQHCGDELLPLCANTALAYRWRYPNESKMLRFALAGPSTEWQWSNSIPFTPGNYRVLLHELDPSLEAANVPGAGVYLHVKVEDSGGHRNMYLSGRLMLANMLRYNLLYKVRYKVANGWHTVSSGELNGESFGQTVLCSAEKEMFLKVKFSSHDSGWSGDIPLKECRKENVPWLVKVPSAGDSPFISVWCRVVRARCDGRLLATLWPLYVLRSQLPLDADVMIGSADGRQKVTASTSTSTAESSGSDARALLVQIAQGRGASTHLYPPGTPAARHALTFQYRYIDCPVTREAVLLYYGVTDTSVFDAKVSVKNIEDVIKEIEHWLDKSGRKTGSRWPYSVVAEHWSRPWLPALLQPRCEVSVRYEAVMAVGGCSLEVQLSPCVLLCNAAPVALTLRAHDAAPLCKLEPGTAVSPPTAVLQKTFYISIERGRETFVSSELGVWHSEPGRYGAPPAGQVAAGHPAPFAVHCSQKAALLTLYYEIKDDINVLGISSTYVLMNRLNTDILTASVVVQDANKDVLLRPKTFKVIAPMKDKSIHGTPLCRFWVHGRSRGGDVSELRAFLCLALPSGADPADHPVPVRIGSPPVRRAVALRNSDGISVPVVVTQQQQGGRWLVTVSPDPCPQFVVVNRTRQRLAIGQPHDSRPQMHTNFSTIVAEVPGVSWHSVVPAERAAHYSTPLHSARSTLEPRAPPPPAGPPCVAFSQCRPDLEPIWSPPIAVYPGEQLVQLPLGGTIKLRIHTHPHSTLLELLNVQQDDISASDIRRRLYGPFQSDPALSIKMDTSPPLKPDLSRIHADNKLLERSLTLQGSVGSAESIGQLSQGSTAISTGTRNTSRQSNLDQIDAANATDPTGSAELNVTEPDQISRESKSTTEPTQRTELVDYYSERMKNVGPYETHPDTKATATKKVPSAVTLASAKNVSQESFSFNMESGSELDVDWSSVERVRCVVAGFIVELAAAADASPLLALHGDRAAVLVATDSKGTSTTVTLSELQIDNPQYDTGLFDFAVIASTSAAPPAPEPWPPLWGMFAERDSFGARKDTANVQLSTRQESWSVGDETFSELTEVELRLGVVALYVEDAYIEALSSLLRKALPPSDTTEPARLLAETAALVRPLRLAVLHVHPLDLTLTLHTASPMYIALDQSPLRLGEFRLTDTMMSVDQLSHQLVVHYLSAALLGAGWVVSGLELLGAPGAFAVRLSSATGGVRGLASAAAAALLRSLSAWAGSLARNLDLLAGDEEHARRAAAARRRPPPTFMAGLTSGIANFAVNILGAVGGLAHHSLVGIAVGETESSAVALRRGLVGAVTKPLSATADLLASAGHGLLRQTGWEPIPQARAVRVVSSERRAGWARDCVRWAFRLGDVAPLTGEEVLLDNAPLLLLFTHKFLIVADAETERIVEMIDFRFCTLAEYAGDVIELHVTQRRQTKNESRVKTDEDDEYLISSAAMARVARYTGAAGAAQGADARVLPLLAAPGRARSLHAALSTLIALNSDTHLHLL